MLIGVAYRALRATQRGLLAVSAEVRCMWLVNWLAIPNPQVGIHARAGMSCLKIMDCASGVIENNLACEPFLDMVFAFQEIAKRCLCMFADTASDVGHYQFNTTTIVQCVFNIDKSGSECSY